jgi:dipeptidyl-peptidase 4
VTDRYELKQFVRDATARYRFERLMEPAGLIRGGTVTPKWMQDGASFWYTVGAPHDTQILRVDGTTGKVAPLFDVAAIRRAFAAIIGEEPPHRGLPFDGVIEVEAGRYRVTVRDCAYCLLVGESIEIAIGKDGTSSGESLLSYQRPVWLGEPALVSEVPSPDRCWCARVEQGNVMLRAAVDGHIMALTTDGTPEFAWDIEAARLRVTSGVGVESHLLDPWSPQGHYLFAIKVDRRAVPEVSFLRYLNGEVQLCAYKTQRAGGPLDIAHPHAIDVRTRRVQRFHVGDTANHYFTLVGWLPDGLRVLFTRHSRDFKRVDLLAGDPRDGSVRVILSETAETFVALQHEVIFAGNNHATILPDGSGLIWRSSRSGWNHLYLYTMDGGTVCTLTKGEFAVMDVVSVDPQGGWVYFTAHHDECRPYDSHLCRVPLRGGSIERLTGLDGQNIVCLSPACKTFTVVNSRPDRPFLTDFHTCDGRHLARVEQADISALQTLGHVVSEEFTVRAADGKTVLWGVMHKPADFDPTRRYPIIDHIYGGPQVAFVAHDFSLGEHCLSRLDRALAQLGYLVICLDARGTPERSKAFQDVVYRNWGRHEIADHAAAIKQLAQRHPFIDLERVGVWGHSWGGYFTIRAMAQAHELFRVGVAAAPGSDVYDSILYEPFLDLPNRSKDVYEYASNYPWLHRITGKLLMVVGTADPRIYSNALRTLDRLIEVRIDHDVVVLPDAGHVFKGSQEEYFVHKLVRHFESHLKLRPGDSALGSAAPRARGRQWVEVDC